MLADAVAELPDPCGDLARKATDDELTLRLPSTEEGPLASPALTREPAGEPGAPAGRAVLGAWRLPALIFEPAAALDLLGALGEPGALPSTTAPGGSVTFLAALARLAADLAARGRVLPALTAGQDGGYAARWRAVLSGADARRARELATAMPPLCRATDADGVPWGSVPPGALDELTDAEVRVRLGRDPGFGLLPARRARRGARVPVAERWTLALTGADPSVPVLTGEDEGEAADPGLPPARSVPASGWWSRVTRRTVLRRTVPSQPEPIRPRLRRTVPVPPYLRTPRRSGGSSSRCSRRMTPARCCPPPTSGPPRRPAGPPQGAGTRK